jgi:UMF1 family MFS transporter
MIPETTDHTSFFSFYDVTEKLATVAGTFSFGIIEAITGSMRYSILAITVFFAIGIVFLLILLVHRRKHAQAVPSENQA